MTNNEKEILNTFSKEKLVDVIVRLSERRRFPKEILILESNYEFSIEELNEIWETVYDKAFELDDADYLADCANLCFRRAMKIEDTLLRNNFLTMMRDDLNRAAEEDGIGMYEDSEWLYLDVSKKIEESI